MSDNQYKMGELNWAELQKQYIDALKFFNSPNPFTTGINNPFFGTYPPENPFMNNSMEQWWKSMNMNNIQNKESGKVFEKLVEQGQFYHFMAEQFSNLFEGLSKFNDSDEDINDFINNKFKNIQELFTKAPENMSWSGFIDPFEKPFQTMKESVSKNVFNFADLFESVQPEIQKMRNKYLSIPGIGHNREIQEKLQKLLKLAAIYQDNENEKQMEMARLTQDALELMRKEIIRMSKDGEKFTSMRQIYDLWVESNEKIYTDFVYSEKYSELNGKVVNSQMAFMQLSHEVNEDILTAMNMPTTKAMNELERRHYELRKKVKALENELNSLKGKSTKKSKVMETKSAVIEAKVETVMPKVAKKKAIRKKAAKKRTVKKEVKAVKAKPEKKKPIKKETKAAQKKAKSKVAVSSKNNVIELKF